MILPVSHVLELRRVSCARGRAALRELSLGFPRGSFSILAGRPDSGHELLWRLLGLQERPDGGEVLLEGQPTAALEETARVKLRERALGFLFAAPFLLPSFTLIENVAMPLFKVSDVELTEARERSERLLDFVGLGEKAECRCDELSLVEQHGASLARALANEPLALLVEGLDSSLEGADLRGFIQRLHLAAAQFSVAVIATASPSFAGQTGHRRVDLVDGALHGDAELLPEPSA